MDMSTMNSQGTPYNINEPYANKLITIIASVIAFLTLRRLFIYMYNKTKTIRCLKFIFNLISPCALFLEKLENNIINKFSYSALYGNCPPLGGVLVTLALISAFLPLLLLDVDLKVNSNRAGFLALATVPFLLSCTGKNSAVSLLTGISSTKLNFLHRILGMALFLCATVHMACMLHSWSKFPTFMKSQLEMPKVRYGLAGYACLCVVILGSCFPIRKHCYELFIVTHLLGMAFIGVIAVHTPYAMRYFISGLICYGLNLIAVWFVKSYVAVARFEVLPGGCIKTSIRLASPLDRHYVGQHVNLCIPAISPFQWHPFTITSVQPRKSEHQNAIEVCICSRGNFTRQLYKTADPTHETRVFVSGPFGTRNIEAARVLECYSSVVIACGGAGVTFGMRLLREITETLLTSNEEDDRASFFSHWKTENIYFYWSVRRSFELEWFNEELEQLVHLFETHDGFPSLHVKFYCTLHDTLPLQNVPERPVAVPNSNANTVSTVHVDESAMNGIILADDDVITEEIKEGNYNRNLPRKKIETIQGQRLDSKPILSVDNDIGAFVCGPIGFNAAFKNAVALQKTSTVHLHCEEFAY